MGGGIFQAAVHRAGIPVAAAKSASLFGTCWATPADPQRPDGVNKFHRRLHASQSTQGRNAQRQNARAFEAEPIHAAVELEPYLENARPRCGPFAAARSARRCARRAQNWQPACCVELARRSKTPSRSTVGVLMAAARKRESFVDPRYRKRRRWIRGARATRDEAMARRHWP